MMLSIVGHKISLIDVAKAVFGKPCGELERFLSSPRYAFFTDSGRSACYLALEVLKKESSRKEVVLPAYTANAVVEAVLKAGLKPVLCDLALGKFNADLESILKVITGNTLAVICIHMFGIPAPDMAILRENLPSDIFLIEDCAQAMGTIVNESYVGCFGDLSFFSFNRGKNLATYGGGCVVTGSQVLGASLEKTARLLKPQSSKRELGNFIKLFSLSFIFNRFFYGIVYPAIARGKEKPASARSNFEPYKYSIRQRKLAMVLSGKFEEACILRFKNSNMLMKGLEGLKGAEIPYFDELDRPVLNRFPVIFADINQKNIIREKLRQKGIEASTFYVKPLHHIFDLGYRKDDFPNAVYFAEHLLTLPVHPLVKRQDIDVMVSVIRKILDKPVSDPASE